MAIAGAFFQGKWCAEQWHQSWVINKVTKKIVLFALFPVIVAIVLWSHFFRNKRLLVNTDNKGVLYAIKSPLVV